jgi:hypothetical protein
VIQAGEAPGKRTKISTRPALAACFRSSVTSSYKLSFTKTNKKAQLLHTFNRQFEHATTTDEVML